MKIPEFLYQPKNAEEKKIMEKRILSKREALKTAPTYETKEEATKKAVDQEREEDKRGINYTSPTVWKEPEDLGTKYAVVEYAQRANAAIGGYTEEVNHRTIFDIAHGRNIDEIEEV